MCAEVQQNREQLNPELCPSIPELTAYLQAQGKLLGGGVRKSGNRCLVEAGKSRTATDVRVRVVLFSSRVACRIFQHGIDLARQRLGSQATVTIIGDTPSDIDAARKVGVPVIALATGIYGFAQLRALDPDACFACSTDLLAFGG